MGVSEQNSKDMERRSSRSRRAFRPFVFLLLSALWIPGSPALASGDGSRVYAPAPVDLNFLVLHLTELDDANRTFDPSIVSPLQRFDTTIGVIQYARTLDLFGRYVMLAGILRGGTTERRTVQSREDRISSSGLADPSLLALVNLVGLPPMSVEEFSQWQPEMTVGLLLALTLPWGEYNRLNAINLGSNRYTLRLGLPVQRPFNGLRGRPATLEFTPSVHFFTENDATGVKQHPLLTLEGQLSQDFTGKLWGALGVLYTYGGKTRSNGFTLNGSQESLALAVTLDYDLSPRWSLNFRYGESVYQNDSGLDGTLYHLKLITRF
jgi:hypothetical protein